MGASTDRLGEVQELVVLKVQVGDLRAVADLFRKMLQLIVGHIQSDQVAQLSCTQRDRSHRVRR